MIWEQDIQVKINLTSFLRNCMEKFCFVYLTNMFSNPSYFTLTSLRISGETEL